MIYSVQEKCDERQKNRKNHCFRCDYLEFCQGDCQNCLDHIHNPNHAPKGAPPRTYDCPHMADVYTCKYACRYTSEIVYALRRLVEIKTNNYLRILSFGCGPCTDLFALDYMKKNGELSYRTIDYVGIDYSQEVWEQIHSDIENCKSDFCNTYFYYKDMREMIHEIEKWEWTPNLIVFQYVFSDMYRHAGIKGTNSFIDIFAKYYNDKIHANTYTILNDVNLGVDYNGGREYFDILYNKLNNSKMKKGRFCNDNAKSPYYPRGFTYGEDSYGEFSDNSNLFDIRKWRKYSPYDTCASAQMLIYKEK